jgi:hypothetical protein
MFEFIDHRDVWLLKLDESGNLLWEKTYGGKDNDAGNSVQQTADGGYIIIGETKSYSQGKNDVWIIKTDDQGEKMWDKTFGRENFDKGVMVRETSDNGYVIVGWGDQSGGAEGKALILKLDMNGNLIWESLFGDVGHNYADDILETEDHNYMVLGSSWVPNGDTGYDVWLMKLNDRGELIWEKKYDRSNSDHGWSLVRVKDGGFLLVGETDHARDDEIWIIKTDDDGTLLWDTAFEGRGFSVQQTSDDGFIIAGSTMKSFFSDFSNALLMKIDSGGNLEWRKVFRGLKPDFFFSVKECTDDGFIVTGYTTQLSYWLGSDLWVLKTDAEGNI